MHRHLSSRQKRPLAYVDKVRWGKCGSDFEEEPEPYTAPHREVRLLRPYLCPSPPRPSNPDRPLVSRGIPEHLLYQRPRMDGWMV